ncbi:MAG: nuclear transport factor 2 family protein [Ignavibacteriaceae bacterium]
MSTEEDVRKVSEQFYTALTRMAKGDAGLMSEIWLHDETATVMHPIGGLEMGWKAIKKSFDQLAELSTAGEITLEDQYIHILGDVSYEVGIEVGKMEFVGRWIGIEHRITNIYHKKGGTWKMIHHHGAIFG